MARSDHRRERWEYPVPFHHQVGFVLHRPKGVINPDELRCFVRIPVISNLLGLFQLQHPTSPLIHRTHGHNR